MGIMGLIAHIWDLFLLVNEMYMGFIECIDTTMLLNFTFGLIAYIVTKSNISRPS